MKKFLQHCALQAIKSKFKCPVRNQDQLEYMLLQKLTVGLHDPMLKQDVSQNWASISSRDELRSKC